MSKVAWSGGIAGVRGSSGHSKNSCSPSEAQELLIAINGGVV